MINVKGEIIDLVRNIVPLDVIKDKAIVGAKFAGVAFLAFSAIKGQVLNKLNEHATWKIAEAQRAQRLNEVRRRLAGPLARSAVLLLHAIDSLLLLHPLPQQHQGEDNQGVHQGVASFFPTTYKEDPEGSVHAMAYKFACYFFWRWQLEGGLVMENVTAEDFWQHAVDHAILEVSKAFQSGKEPLQMLEHQRTAVAELMSGKRVEWGAFKDSLLPLQFSQFDQVISAAVHGGEMPDGLTNQQLKQWQQFFNSFCKEMDRIAQIQVIAMKASEEVSAEDSAFHSSACSRLCAIRTELQDLIYVLSRNPNSTWFKKKRELVDGSRPKELVEQLAKRGSESNWLASG